MEAEGLVEQARPQSSPQTLKLVGRGGKKQQQQQQQQGASLETNFQTDNQLEQELRVAASVDSFTGYQTAMSGGAATGLLSSSTFAPTYEDDEVVVEVKSQRPPQGQQATDSTSASIAATAGSSLFASFPTMGFITRQFTQAVQVKELPSNNLNSEKDSASLSTHPQTTPLLSSIPLSQDEENEAFLFARLRHSRQSTTEDLALLTGTQHLGNPVAEQEKKQTGWFNELETGFKTARDAVIGVATTSTTSTTTSPKSSNPSILTQPVVDWDFWGKVINDYETVLRTHPRQFQKNLRLGLPEPIRGMMWQLMSNSKNESLEEEYLSLLQKSSRNEKIISRDLARTFPGHPFFKDPSGPGQTSLFNVLKAYSIYDKEIGYCQGLPFVVGPLLLNMPEEQAFCVLVKLMFEYNFRDLYTPKMLGLQVRNHQFDRLLQEQFPVVYAHLENQDVKSTMYASQWFMTLFAYRFPLELVFRILDVIFAEGPEAVLRFALALIKHNADHIVTLEFEKLLHYLKEGLFDMYISNMDQLVSDASTIIISKRKLDFWSKEYLEVLRQQSPEVLEAEAVKVENRKLDKSLKLLERNYTILNREHVDLVNKFIAIKTEHELEHEKVGDLEEQVKSLKAILTLDRKQAEEAVRKEMEGIVEKNIQLTHINSMLEDTIGELEQKLLTARNSLAESENSKEDLKGKLNRLSRTSK